MLLMMNEYKCRLCLDIFFLLGSLTGQPLDGERLVNSFYKDIIIFIHIRCNKNQGRVQVNIFVHIIMTFCERML